MDRLSDISNIKNILSKHGFSFSKSLGQNFLINPSVCPRMADESITDDNTGVIEIGPGIGVLTHELAKRAKKVVAIEIDTRLIPVLGETLSEHDNVKVINADVLKTDLHELIKEEFSGMKVVICANLPYYITSPVIMSLLESRLPIESITVMVQKEAAVRLCAEEGSRECGAVTAAVRYFSEPEMLFKVSAGSFMPAPKVDSAVIRLNVLQAPAVSPIDEKKFFKVIKSAFAQRRKTLPNAVSSGMGIDKQVVLDAVKKAGIKETARAEQVTLKDFCSLSDLLFCLPF